MLRVMLAITIFLAASGGGYFLWLKADEFAAAQSEQASKAKSALDKEKEVLEHRKNEDSTLKAKATKLREAGFFDLDRTKILDHLANLGTGVSYSMTENEWKGVKNGKEFQLKMTASLPHEEYVSNLFDKIEHGNTGLLVWDSIEISKGADSLALAISGKWYGIDGDHGQKS